MAKTKKDKLADFKLPPRGKTPKDSLSLLVYKFLNPYGGEILEVGSKIAIYWTGCLTPPTPNDSVNIYFDNCTQNSAIIKIASNIPYNNQLGFFLWTIPDAVYFLNNKGLYLMHSNQYEFYIENISRTAYGYSKLFKVT